MIVDYTFSIYTLSDPRDNIVKYVGVTKDPKTRFRAHMLNQYGNKEKSSWIKELKFLGLKAIMTVIFETKDVFEACSKELYYFQQFNEKNKLLSDMPMPYNPSLSEETIKAGFSLKKETIHFIYYLSIKYAMQENQVIDYIMDRIAGNFDIKYDPEYTYPIDRRKRGPARKLK